MAAIPTSSELIGYDPGVGSGASVKPSSGPATRDQWIADFAISSGASMANGTLRAGPGTIFTQEFMAAHGLNISFDPADWSTGDKGGPGVSEITHDQLVQLGTWVVDHWNELDANQKSMFSDPSTLPAAAPGLSDTDKNNLATAQINAANNAAQAARDKQQQEAEIAAAKLSEEGQNTRNQANIDAQKAIADANRVESARQFDITTKEGARQFNVDTIMGLFDRGIALAQNPVDWLGYQYWLENMNIPLTATNFASAATMMGAVPPSGPSQAGPVVGGPGVVYGDMSIAENFGITNAGPVPLEQAVSQFPGAGSTGGMQMASGLTSPETINNFGGMEVVNKAWTEAVERGKQAFTGNPELTDFFNKASEAVTTSVQGLASNIPQQLKDALAGGQNPLSGQPPPQMTLPQIPGTEQPPAPPPPPGGYATGVAGQTGTGGGPTPPTTGGPYTGLEGAAGINVLGQELPPIPGATAPLPQPTPGQPTPALPTIDQPAAQQQQGLMTTGQVPQANQQAGGVNPDLEAALQALAQQLGLPVEQVRAMFPVELMPQTQSPGGVANSPIIQSLRNQTPFGLYNTGPRDGRFTQMPGFGGVSTGIRGGQDVNASHYLSALGPQQEMAQGVFKAQGLSVPGTLQQMMRSSPVTDVDASVRGMRR